jgi:KUP system potassium uptake protein
MRGPPLDGQGRAAYLACERSESSPLPESAHVADEESQTQHGALRPAVMLGALGIVYGDIGTSPLYAFKEAVRAASAGAPPTSIAVTGAVSLILWSLILIV